MVFMGFPFVSVSPTPKLKDAVKVPGKSGNSEFYRIVCSTMPIASMYEIFNYIYHRKITKGKGKVGK